ncbi:MAG: FAD-binding oxidoreductase [Chloroflexi bacterium]|nr:FAD-binding oxidoreductase [Chloroflexota bacterium]
MTTQKFVTAQELPATADVVIIGGGPAGAAAVWELERAAPGTKVVLLEQADRLGAGSSTASLENYRSCWPALPMMKQMRRSIAVFHDADAYLGAGAAQAIHAKERGYLFCGFTPAQAAALRQEVEHLHAIGLTHIEYLQGDEVAYRYGWLGPRVIAAKFDPRAGWLDSNALIYRYVQSSPSVTVVLSVQDVRILVDSGRVRGVQTAHGAVSAPKVLIANGADARRIGRSAGVELPLVVRPRQSVTTAQRHPEFPEDGPMVIGAAPHPHMRPEARTGAIFGWEYSWNSKKFRTGGNAHAPHDALIEPLYPLTALKDPRYPSLALALLARQFGHKEGEGFAHPCYLRGLWQNIGYYTHRDHSAAIKPDGTPYESERAIIDAHPALEGLFVSVAHVGHGIMTSPAAGEIAACKMLGAPLAEAEYAAFGFDTLWVAHDEAVL